MPLVLAHRGGVRGTHINENSLHSFKRIFIKKNVDGIECDLRRCFSGEIVITHDAILPYSSMEIKNMSLDEIADNYDICTLYELLDLANFLNYQGLINLEIKEYNIAQDLSIELKKYPNLKFMISSFLHHEVQDTLNYFDNFHNIRFALLFASFPLTLFDTLKNTDYTIVISKDVLPDITSDLLNKLSHYKERVFIYTVNALPQFKQLTTMGFNIITDMQSFSLPSESN